MRLARSALLVVALLLSACAGTTPSPGAHTSTSTGLKGIATSYLDLVAASNKDTCEFNAVLSQSAPALADLTEASANYAATLATLIDGLHQIAWPAEIKQDAKDLIDSLVANETHARAMAEANSLDAFIAADNELIAANGLAAVAATQLRKDIGLGSGGNPCAS
jgi:ABC-type glycerol-3-phosphate transport system substrate-binding protein